MDVCGYADTHGDFRSSCVDMCVDLCIDVCIDTHLDTRTGMCIGVQLLMAC